MNPKFMFMTCMYELKNGQKVTADIELGYDRGNGLSVRFVDYFDGDAKLVAFSGLPWTEQVWLVADLDKRIKRYCASNFEKAFAHFELNKRETD